MAIGHSVCLKNLEQSKRTFGSVHYINNEQSWVTIKPGFHMNATIAVMAAIAEKNKFSDHMETTFQRL